MIQHIPSKERYQADHGWLQSRFSFSFADYHDPANLHFGQLRVFNDDIVQGGGGFGMHPHRDMEIVTYVIDGQLQHRDNMGHSEVLRPGEAQRMTAGTGIVHSEFNPSPDKPVHFLQMWIMPKLRNLTPSYEQRAFPFHSEKNKLIPFVSGGDVPETMHIQQDAVFYAGRIEAGTEIQHSLANGRLAHLFIIEGDLQLNGVVDLHVGDAARISQEDLLSLRAVTNAHVILIDLVE